MMSLGWLFFLPNSAYLFTELLHLFRYLEPQGDAKFWMHIDFWYSLTIAFTAALIGLLLSVYTVYQMKEWLCVAAHRAIGWLCAGGAFLLSALGVYIGRFNRWNSWDILDQPHVIVQELVKDWLQEGSMLGEFVRLLWIIQVFCYVLVIRPTLYKTKNPVDERSDSRVI
ncbi:DUF1361 domain-containing protein [Paenibacillus filicis]|uniref:DUF1361 domain-containing protein n=2 Tax=Paenibacillus filicis TaxID=669464 RepID=A0ABU9DFJ2_9BACL